MAPHVDNIHPYAAHRLVKLFELLSRRYRRILFSTTNIDGNSNSIGNATTDENIKFDISLVTENPQEVGNENENDNQTKEEQPRRPEEMIADFFTQVHEVRKSLYDL